MRGYKHLFINTPIMVITASLLYYYVLSSTILVIGAYLGVIFGNISDMDLTVGRKYHRHVLFHSVIWTLIMYVFAWQHPEILLLLSFTVLGVGLHCLEDVNLIKSTMRGTYTIKTRQSISGSVRGLNGMKSTLWLVGNFVLSVIIFTLTWRCIP